MYYKLVSGRGIDKVGLISDMEIPSPKSIPWFSCLNYARCTCLLCLPNVSTVLVYRIKKKGASLDVVKAELFSKTFLIKIHLHELPIKGIHGPFIDWGIHQL